MYVYIYATYLLTEIILSFFLFNEHIFGPTLFKKRFLDSSIYLKTKILDIFSYKNFKKKLYFIKSIPKQLY